MTKLPESLEEKTIEKMLPGDTAFTLSWAMWADGERNLWINGKYPITDAVFGTSKMRIKRTKTGVIVYRISIKDERYSPQSTHGYVGGSDADMLPVEALR